MAEETKTETDEATKAAGTTTTATTTTTEEAKNPTIESDAAALSEEDLKAVADVKERLKFFFSDANVRQDIFIRKLLMSSDDKAVPVDALLRFNTIKKHSEKSAVVVKAAKELADSLVVDETKMTISRVVPFTKDMMDGNIPKSLYVTNLPVKVNENESKRYDVRVDEIRSLFDKYGDVAIVKLKFAGAGGPKHGDHGHYGPSDRKNRRNIPIGAAMIEFHTTEDLEKAAEATLTTKGGETVEPKDKITLPETETRKSTTDLEVVLLSEHVAKRKEEKAKRETKKRSAPEAAAGAGAEDEKESPKFTFDWKPGCVIKIKGLPKECDREALLAAIGKALDISADEVKARKIYVDYSRGQTDGAIRFPEQSDTVADVAKKLKDGELMILDAKVEDASILEGEDEKKYWGDFIEFKTKQMIQRAEEKKRGNKRQKTRQ
mmetsp:Transcript_27568/g.75219  ORF Transcript_27568/g.75219 Transcript_27568/m.75219 type:complete len:435 (+) Transcript_27568:288-1592(+)